MADVTVVTLYRSGGDFDARWVWALLAGVQEHLPGAGFKVLTDEPKHFGHRGEKMDPVLPKWWGKALLFEPGRFSGRMLYLDLDSLPVGDMAPLAAYNGPLAMLEDFREPGKLASGVVLWDADDPPPVYDRFMAEPDLTMKRYPYRSDHWYRTFLEPDFIQDLMPGVVVSLKDDARQAPPEDAALCLGHGNPRLSDPDPAGGWAHELWTERVWEP